MAKKLLPLDEQRNIEIIFPERMKTGRPLLILAHGSANDMNSPFLTTIAQPIEGNDINVVRFNFPYKVAGKQDPDRAEILENSWKKVVDWASYHLDFEGLYIGGKSMGARVAATVAGDLKHLQGLVFLGYPLHLPGKFDQIRDEYLLQLRVPMLFVQGTRDAFARMDLLQATLSDLREYATLHWIEGGDHSFKVLIHPGTNYPEVLRRVGEKVANWILGVRETDEER